MGACINLRVCGAAAAQGTSSPSCRSQSDSWSNAQGRPTPIPTALCAGGAFCVGPQGHLQHRAGGPFFLAFPGPLHAGSASRPQPPRVTLAARPQIAPPHSLYRPAQPAVTSSGSGSGSGGRFSDRDPAAASRPAPRAPAMLPRGLRPAPPLPAATWRVGWGAGPAGSEGAAGQPREA